MSRPWLAEKAVSSELATTLIQQQFPEIRISSLEKFGEGWDNVAYLINKHYVFRFPRRQIAVALLENECKLLPLIQKELNLKIPAPIFIGEPSELFAWPFAGYELVPGVTADVKGVSLQTRIKNIKPIALFLKHLHSISLSIFSEPWEAHDELQRLDVPVRAPQTLERLYKLEHEHGFKNLTPLKNHIETISLEPAQTTMCLVHGDLYAKHMVVNEKNLVTGIIDWGDSHIGNKAVDLSIVYSFIPVEHQVDFFQHYGLVDEATLELAFFRAIYSTATIMVYALDVGDMPLMREAEYSFDNLRKNRLLCPA